ncbi:MAG: cation transporter, partial [Bdellovibrionales bacterium]|nr:cation transporter [Bdellovibrionales bacterium]
RLWYPEVLVNTEYGLLFAILSVFGNAVLWQLNFKHESSAASPVIDSQWRLFRAKTAASSAVVLSLGVGTFFADYSFAQYADPFGALVLSAFILYSAITIVSDSMNDLVDRSLEEALQMIILAALVKYDNEYMGLERIRSRRSGNRVYVELFLMFADDRTMADIRDSAKRIRAELEANIPASEVIVIPC